MEISDKKTVKLHYKGTLDNGEVFDSSEGKDPLEFVYGLGMIIPGLEEGISGLKVGDKKEVKISTEKAYGPRMEQAMQEVPKTQMPQDVELKVGMQLAAQGPQGVIPVVISEIKDDSIVVDFNHPLAGKDLTFNVEIVDVKETSEEDMQKFMNPHHGHDHGDGGCCGGDCHDGDDCCGSGACSTDKKK